MNVRQQYIYKFKDEFSIFTEFLCGLHRGFMSGFRGHTRFLKGGHAGQTCGVSWVEDQGEGNEGSSRGVRVVGAPANTDGL